MSINLVCEIEIDLGGQNLDVNAAQRLLLINNLDIGSLHYINQQRGGKITV